MPDGRTFTVTAPEGATQEQIFSYVKKNLPPIQQPPPEKPPSPEQDPTIGVGGGLFTFAAHAGQPAVDTAAGIVQHGASLLHAVGIPVDEQAAENVANDIRSGYAQFTKGSQTHYGVKDEDYPITGTAGDVAGQILLYSATGPEFLAAGVGKTVPWAGSLIGRMIERGAQGGALSAVQAKPGEDIGSQAFFGALGAAGGEAAGTAVQSGIAKIANSRMIGRLIQQARAASRGWIDDSTKLGFGFQGTFRRIQGEENRLTQEVAQLQRQDIAASGGEFHQGDADKMKSSNWSDRTKEKMKELQEYKDSTEFFKNKVFSKLSKMGDETAGAGATHPKESNDEIIKYVSGEDRTPARIVSKALSPNQRTLVAKGIFYNAIHEATTNDGNIDPGKLKDLLGTKGVEEFLKNSPGGTSIAKGFTNLVEEGKSTIEKHPYILAHGVGRLSTSVLTAAGIGGTGYAAERYGRGQNELESGAAGFMLFFLMLHATNRLLGSQSGLNLFAASSKLTPGTPKMAKAFAQFTRSLGAPLGADLATAADPFKNEENPD